jgi:hypothetical protein
VSETERSLWDCGKHSLRTADKREEQRARVSVLEPDRQGNAMTEIAELYSHAERCDRLAELCFDASVAYKLRFLAQDYRQLAKSSRVFQRPAGAAHETVVEPGERARDAA